MNDRRLVSYRVSAATGPICTLSTAIVVACVPVAGQSQTSEAPLNIFGVYGPPPFVGGGPPRIEPEVYPFTEQGRMASEAFEPADDPANTVDCILETMPPIVFSGNPMEIIDEGEQIVMHYERFNTVRTIDMSGNPPPADRTPSELGHSVGRWEGGELIIETTHLLGGAVRNGDLPLSAEAHVTERYWREPGENDLQLRVEVRDPVNYTEPFTMGRAFIWAPDEEIRDYGCVSLGPKDTPPDLDELVRRLEEL
jgi:hypothetical protein